MTTDHYSDDEMLQLSGIQHYVFCPRQWALIHIDNLWADNYMTAEGSVLHENVDNPFAREINGSSAVTLRGFRLASATLGLSGTADAVELLPHDGAPVSRAELLHNLIRNTDAHFSFSSRNRRPPTDAVNAMLSFGYSLLASDCTSALEGVGLDPAVGFLHAMRPGRNSLALDLMEELRAYIVDRFVVSLINNHQISASDFKFYSSVDDAQRAPVIFTDDGRRKFLSAWQTKKKTEITHPFLNEKICVGLLPYAQALLLARYVRGDIDSYPVFFAR